jgi:adenosylcobinamide-GDP ribazoletransferase
MRGGGGGWRLAVTLLTVVPLPGPAAPGAPTRRQARSAMAWAPAVGLALGGLAAGVLWAGARWTGPLLGAVLAIAALAGLTGGLHLDGLADLADGLGSRRPAAGALDILKQSDIGPFGVAALVFTLLLQVAALDRAQVLGRGPLAVVAAAVTARLAITAACAAGVPAARPGGLGALVAGTVRPAVLAGLAAAVVGGAAACGVIYAFAVVAGLAAGLALTAVAVRRLGGITGDVLGAVAEVSAATCLLVAAVR